jgi:NAD(P)H-dependent flavin oxidoreductase YrpB (nitropropane dioxygenase family)
MIRTELCELLGIEYPIIQAGMGPFCTVNLAVAVSNAGGMGTVSIPYGAGVTPDVARKTVVEHLHRVKRLTNKNFAVNTPIGSETTTPKDVRDLLASIIEAVVEEKQRDPELKKRLVLYITSGGNPKEFVKKIKDAGFLHFHVVGSVRHAKKVEAMGLDGVIASGYEMGGHTHLADRAVHTFILVPAVVEAVKIPVIASGGICDGRTLAAALALGASGVQMGTRFIATKECEFHENYKKFIVEAGEHSDTIVPSFIGPARVLKNEAVKKLLEEEKEELRRGVTVEKAALIDKLLKRAEQEGDVINGVVAAGQVASRIKDIPSVEELIKRIVSDAARIIKDLQRFVRV